jgi:hypothetical protein
MKIFLTISVLASFLLSVVFPKSNPTMNDKNFPEYTAEWVIVDHLMSQGLIEDAMVEIEKIYVLARRDQNHPQLYKCLLRMETLAVQKDEQGQQGVIRRLEEKSKSLTEPSLSLLYSVLGELYFNLSQHSYYGRSQKTDVPGLEQDTSNLDSWSNMSLITKSNYYYLASIKAEELKTSGTEDYKSILDLKNDRIYRPFLFDILAQRAITHFANAQTGLVSFNQEIKPADQFAPLEKFIQLELEPSSIWALYQKVIGFHRQNKQEEAMIDANLARLKYAYQLNSDSEEFQDMYLNALEQYASSLKSKSQKALVSLELLEFYYTNAAIQVAQTVTPKSKYLLKVDSIANSLSMLNDTTINERISNYKALIRAKDFNINLEEVNLPGKPCRMLIQHRNLNELYFRIYKFLPTAMDINPGVEQENLVAYFLKQNPYRQWKDQWPQSVDFNYHQVELKVDGLDPGVYAILSSPSSEFNTESQIKLGYFQSSGISAVILNGLGNGQQILVMDRQSGQPIKGAKLITYSPTNRYNRNQPEFKIQDRLLTDIDGKIIVKARNGYRFKIEYKKDVLYSNQWLYSYDPEPARETKMVHFFTDRKIYRPGQTVYFKILNLLLDKNGLPKILTNQKSTVILYNANHQNIGEFKLSSNAYGTAHGSFILPHNGLNGDYSLGIEGLGQYSFKVEEYKRPSFEVKLYDPLDGVSLNDSVRIKGSVNSYSGVPLSGCVVRYKVMRSSFMPYYPSWYFKQIYPSQDVQIDYGKTLTDDKGNFEFAFFSKSSPGNTEQSLIDQFKYEVEAVSLTGETQTSQSDIQLSRQKIFLSSNLRSCILKDSVQQIRIFSKNIKGLPLNAEIQCKIFEVEVPKVLLRKRSWEKPDLYKYSLKEYKKYFPNDVYDQEDELSSWPVHKLLYEITISKTSESNLALAKIPNSTRAIKLVVQAKDSLGNVQNYVDYAILINESESTIYPKPDLITVKDQVLPGQQLDFLVLAAAKNSWFFNTYESRSGIQSKWVNTNSLYKFGAKPVISDCGTIYFTSFCVIQNNIYEFHKQVTVPWKSKDLEIRTNSFRTKILPGSKEEWEVEILNIGGKSQTVEMLASMYDASLDALIPFNWKTDFWPNYHSRIGMNSVGFNIVSLNFLSYREWMGEEGYHPIKEYTSLRTFDITNAYNPLVVMAAPMQSREGGEEMDQSRSYGKSGKVFKKLADAENELEPSSKIEKPRDIQLRKNLNETVFFFPQLISNSEGSVRFSFSMNEALTRWKMQLMAHTKDLEYGFKTYEIVTQKPVQIKPFYPRYFRQGDTMEISALVSNLSEENQKTEVSLKILDISSKQDLSNIFISRDALQTIQIEAGKSKSFFWKIIVPKDETRILLLQFVAGTLKHTDGEEMTIPVITNRKLITETLPLPIKGNEKKSYQFEAFTKAFSATSVPVNYTIEFSSHPIWYAIQSLPYIIEFPHECSEQLMSRIFANSLGKHILSKYPKVKEVLTQIKMQGSNKSPLLQNEDLKSALLEETPWVLEAKNEQDQLNRISLLMDLNTLSQNIDLSIKKLQSRQSSSGSFSWFPEGYPDRYMTQHIVSQIAHLKRLGALESSDKELQDIVKKAQKFLNEEILKDYDQLAMQVKKGYAKWEDNNLSHIQLHYYYCKSYFPDWPSDDQLQVVHNYYKLQMENHWKSRSIYDQGLAALVLHKSGNKNTSNLIVQSLKQRSVAHPELGTYWKNNWSYYWYEQPVETQSLMIEVFAEIQKDKDLVDQMKVWLLKNKQTQNWGTTKSTTEAIFSLVAFGNSWVESNKVVEIEIAGKPLVIEQTATGTQYFKKSIPGIGISKEMSKVKVSNPNSNIAWGAVYYQHLEDMDKTGASVKGVLELNKQLFLKHNNGKKEELISVTKDHPVRIGDIVVARIILKSDRPMDYVHLKIMRASGLEPVDQLSKYVWNNGVSFYRSPRDLVTDCFFSTLPKGTHVIEYEMRAAHKGKFSDGITTLQCMYAPEYSAHSKGIRISIE